MQSPVALVDQTFLLIFSISGVILCLIVFMMLLFIFKYKRKKHPVATQIRGNIPLEVVWTVVPTLIALGMFYSGWQSYLGLRNVPEGAMAISASAMKFAYDFTYEGGKSSHNLLVVPEGKPIKVTLTSDDVIHGFSIPAFRVKIDAIPGRKTYAWFLPDRQGEFNIFCSVYCGVDHAGMLGKLRIVVPEEFEKWLKQPGD